MSYLKSFNSIFKLNENDSQFTQNQYGVLQVSKAKQYQQIPELIKQLDRFENTKNSEVGQNTTGSELIVKLIIAQLKMHGIEVEDTGGEYNSKLANTIKAFQAKKGLPETGKVDHSTYNVLFGGEAPANKKSKPNVKSGELTTNEKIALDQLILDGYTREAAAAVMGVVGGESGFQMFKEASYKNTDNSRIRAIFSKKLGKMSDADLDILKKSDEAFFNAVYGGEAGNAPDEGYKYVGRGFNGITFQGNYKAAEECTKIGFVDNPELMEEPENAAKALSCYFKKIKNIKDFEDAYKQAFLQNAGPAYKWEKLLKSKNPVIRDGIPLKRKKAKEYYQKIAKFFDASNKDKSKGRENS
jgi:predicted chitinase